MGDHTGVENLSLGVIDEMIEVAVDHPEFLRGDVEFGRNLIKQRELKIRETTKVTGVSISLLNNPSLVKIRRDQATILQVDFERLTPLN